MATVAVDRFRLDSLIHGTVKDLVRQTIESEISLEVEYDNEALDQIYMCNRRLLDCLHYRYWLSLNDDNKWTSDQEEYLLELSKTRFSEQPSFSYEKTFTRLQTPAITQPIKEFKILLVELRDRGLAPKVACGNSRLLRYEVVCECLLSDSLRIKPILADSLSALRNVAERLSASVGREKLYVRNIRTRRDSIQDLFSWRFLKYGDDPALGSIEPHEDEPENVTSETCDNIENGIDSFVETLASYRTQQELRRQSLTEFTNVLQRVKKQISDDVELMKARSERLEPAQRKLSGSLDSLEDAIRSAKEISNGLKVSRFNGSRFTSR
ncbi:MAG: hypothetical protein AAGA92_07815 [Planctomycetota bacterium]